MIAGPSAQCRNTPLHVYKNIQIASARRHLVLHYVRPRTTRKISGSSIGSEVWPQFTRITNNLLTTNHDYTVCKIYRSELDLTHDIIIKSQMINAKTKIGNTSRYTLPSTACPEKFTGRNTNMCKTFTNSHRPISTHQKHAVAFLYTAQGHLTFTQLSF